MIIYNYSCTNSGRVGMSDERDKLLNVMHNLESDYKSGKISAEKYSYFRSKYEDKLNSIDAKAATRRIRSMQGKPSNDTKKARLHKKPTKNKKKEERDLVQKYIINPKKDDSKYNKKKKSSISLMKSRIFYWSEWRDSNSRPLEPHRPGVPPGRCKHATNRQKRWYFA